MTSQQPNGWASAPEPASESVDVAIIGSGVAGLAAARALLKVRTLATLVLCVRCPEFQGHHTNSCYPPTQVDPSMKLKLFERRPPPETQATAVGGFVRLEPNGLKAAAAIDPRLYRRLLARGSTAKTMMLHDVEEDSGGSWMGTCLQRLDASSAQVQRWAQPNVVLGWSEVEVSRNIQLANDLHDMALLVSSHMRSPQL